MPSIKTHIGHTEKNKWITDIIRCSKVTIRDELPHSLLSFIYLFVYFGGGRFEKFEARFSLTKLEDHFVKWGMWK